MTKMPEKSLTRLFVQNFNPLQKRPSRWVFLFLVFIAFISTSSQAQARDKIYRFTVEKGDSVSRYFQQLGLSSQLLSALISKNKKHKSIHHLVPGQRVIIAVDESGSFRYLTHYVSDKKTLTIGEINPLIEPTSLKKINIYIKSSLNVDGKKAGLDLKTINTIVSVFSWKIDFKALKKGDRFVVIKDLNDEVLALSYTSLGEKIKAYQFSDALGRSDFYDQHGRTIEPSFLSAPLKYKRISSGYQLKRFHPILKTWRPHRAIDFAADTGTPVYSVADGTIKKKKDMGALGKTVFIQHGQNYTTVYAHLSRYARYPRVGQKVKRGQVIGYVGSTGRSTGPHLHYELRYKGKRKNPLKFKLPKQKTIKAKQMWSFKKRVNQLNKLL